MKVAVLSYFDSARFAEYPITHSLGSLRLGAYLRARRPEWTVSLRAFDERKFSAARTAQSLSAEGFDVVGLPAYIWTMERSRELAHELLSAPGAPLVICGGPETRTMDYLSWPDRTVFVVGQGEDPLLWLCSQRDVDPGFDGRALSPDVAQPVYSTTRDRIAAYRFAVANRGDRRLPHGVPLFGPEALDLVDGDPIETDFTWYETARGCIYDCSFCGHNTLPFFATFDLEFVRREIENLRDQGIRRVFLIDPILGGKAARGKEVLRLFRTLAPQIRLSAYLRPEFLDDEFVDTLVEGNIHELLMGLQTTNPNVPKHVRGNHFQKIMKFVPHLAARGVPWRAELIVGLPGDDMAGLRESLRFTIEELRPWSVHAYHLTAIPETKLFDLLDKFDDDIWIKADQRLRVVSASSYTASELEHMLVYAGATTSLHSYWRERNILDPSFDAIDRVVAQALSHQRLAAREAFIRMSHEHGHRFWSAYAPLLATS